MWIIILSQPITINTEKNKKWVMSKCFELRRQLVFFKNLYLLNKFLEHQCLEMNLLKLREYFLVSTKVINSLIFFWSMLLSTGLVTFFLGLYCAYIHVVHTCTHIQCTHSHSLHIVSISISDSNSQLQELIINLFCILYLLFPTSRILVLNWGC